jgi:DNA-binding transcriptional LysR family regulator
MELRHLRYFCAVAEAGGFARAAERMHVSQSAVSEQLRDLEDELKVELFDRRERRARLTMHGEVFLTEARGTLAAADRAVEAAQRSARGEIGTLTIGFFAGGTDSQFPGLIRRFRQHAPGVRVSLMEMSPTRQHEALLAGTIDIGFTRVVPEAHKAQLCSERFYVEPLVAVLPSSHALAGKTVDLRKLAKERFVIAQRESSPALFDKVIALCRDAGFSPVIAASSGVASGVLTFVAAGEGVAILPKNTLKLAPADVVGCPLRSKEASIDLVIAWSVKREGPLHRSFLALARTVRGEASLKDVGLGFDGDGNSG